MRLSSRGSTVRWDNLIDWSRVPDEANFQLVFPQRDILEPDQFDEVKKILRSSSGRYFALGQA